MIKLKNLFQALVVASLLICLNLFAQDTEPDDSTAQEIDRQNTETQQNGNPQTSNTDTEDQVFIPSEEISEDAPVAFPVDI